MQQLMELPGAGLLGYAVPFLIVLTIVVFFHELGHFLVARWYNVRVDAFSVGFGPELWGRTDAKGTRWKVSAIPLGGYVKFFGDDSVASTPDFERAATMSEAERKVSFTHKPVGQRAAIVAAGPLANFILAVVIFSVSFMTLGRVVTEPLVTGVQPGSPAEQAGFMSGDIVRRVDGTRIESFTDIPRLVAPNPGREMTFVVERDGGEVGLTVTPKLEARTDRFGNTQEIGFIGLVNDSGAANMRIVRSGPVEAVTMAFGETWFIITHTLGYVGDILIGERSADQLGGPLRIAKVSGDVATLGVGALLNLAALLSVSIGLLNLFPIPMLDGGHLVYYAIEAVRGRPLSERMQEMGFRLGLAIVLMLMVVATWNDVTQLFLRSS
ncbi:MAG: zinc metalloprotease [Alphaproteobacteria bacterium]|nr:MAG: zinc metalloprotease [Alphaproteobacteria bacterium]